MSLIKSSTEQTVAEEWANSVTHGLGALLSIAAVVILVVASRLYGDAWRIVSSSIFGASLVILYSSSTIYHWVSEPHLKRGFRVLDHASIYILIAGSYTPFTLVNMRGGWGWSLFGVIWGLAIIGVVLKIHFVERYEMLSTIIYLAMGWLMVIAIEPLMDAVPLGGLLWLVGGGVCYTLGVVFFIWERLLYSHAIWHLFVLGGSICHFFAVLYYVVLG